jgi:histidyl-tRNA synthetase
VLPFEEIKEAVVFSLSDLLRFGIKEILNKKRIERLCSVEIIWQGSLKKRMEKVAKNGATHVVLFAPEEASRRACIVKNMQTGGQQEVSVADFGNAKIINDKKFEEIFGI